MRSPLPVPDSLARVLTGAPVLARACLVGGCVRDWLLGLPVTDYDVDGARVT